MFKQCKNCDHQNKTDALFCNQCGAQLDSQIQCRNCQTHNAADAQFCYRCGQAITAVSFAKRPANQPRSVPEPSMSGSGWQPSPSAPLPATYAQSEQRSASERRSVPGQGPPRTGFDGKKIGLTLFGLVLVPILWLVGGFFLFSPSRNLEDSLIRLLVVSFFPAVFIISVWFGKGSRTPSTRHGKQTMQGEVRGFRERMERKNQKISMTSDDTIWTFRLERYQDGSRLTPIPVEMRGHKFTGSIIEGDTVMLLDKWRGEGLHRTRQVFNVTNGYKVEARKSSNLYIWLNVLWVAFVLGAFLLFIINI